MSSKDFDLVVTKNKEGIALESPTTVKNTATLTENTLSIVSADGETSFEIDRASHEWSTVEDAVAWFLDVTEGKR
jgi:hypothetical protein